VLRSPLAGGFGAAENTGTGLTGTGSIVMPSINLTQILSAEDLQRFLNTFPGIALRVDGQPGQKTSDAVKQILGFHLQGDPRSAAI
jgi:hypothetical protein